MNSILNAVHGYLRMSVRKLGGSTAVRVSLWMTEQYTLMEEDEDPDGNQSEGM